MLLGCLIRRLYILEFYYPFVLLLVLQTYNWTFVYYKLDDNSGQKYTGRRLHMYTMVVSNWVLVDISKGQK